MSYSHVFSSSIFDALGVLNSFSISETIWRKYENFAITKLNESTLKIRGTVYFLKDLTADEAKQELNLLNQLIPILSKLRSAVESNKDENLINFKTAVSSFFDSVDLLFFSLRDAAEVNSSYELSLPVLSEDWVNEKDEHWNNY